MSVFFTSTNILILLQSLAYDSIQTKLDILGLALNTQPDSHQGEYHANASFFFPPQDPTVSSLIFDTTTDRRRYSLGGMVYTYLY